MIFGAVTYKRRSPFESGRGEVSVVVVCNLGINTWSLSVLYGDASGDPAGKIYRT
ncbi:MAG: hypothetical protein ACLTKI_04150 [Lachnospiraceae bacterium]